MYEGILNRGFQRWWDAEKNCPEVDLIFLVWTESEIAIYLGIFSRLRLFENNLNSIVVGLFM